MFGIDTAGWIAIISALISAAGTGYGAIKANQAAHKPKPGPLGGGSGSAIPQPSAMKFLQALDDQLKSDTKDGSPQATPLQQGLSLGPSMKSALSDIPAPKEFDSSFAKADQSAMPISKIEDPAPVQSAANSGSSANAISGYAGLAQNIAQLYALTRKESPTPNQLPQAGPMDLQPTAYKFI